MQGYTTVAHIDLPFFGKVGASADTVLAAFKQVLLGTRYEQEGKTYAVVAVEWGTNKIVVKTREVGTGGD